MVRKLMVSFVWFPCSCGLLLLNLFLIRDIGIKNNLAEAKREIVSPLGDISSYRIASSANTSMVLGSQVISGDAREHLLTEFLNQYESPLAPYASHIVEEADKNGIDFRLIVSIAMCESNLGKRIPGGSHNAWGIAVYTGQNSGAVFEDWPTAIHWVSKYIRERYINKGVGTLQQIGAIYAPPSVLTGNSWSNCVESFQTSIF